MNILNDLIYFTYIGVKEKHILKIMYDVNRSVFLSHLNQLFDVEFKNNILKLVGEPEIENPEKVQQEINNIFTDIALYLNKNLSKEGRDFWYSRGITDEQISTFKLGDNYSWLSSLDSPYFTNLVKTYNPVLVYQIAISLADQIRTAKRLYGNGHAVCTPSFDSSGICRGLVFRIIYYVKGAKQLKNMYKFYNPFSWSYLFNFKTVEENDELIMVEGVFDALALMRAGYTNVISPSMVRLSPYHTRVLKDKKLHVLFDRDRGGLEGLRFIKDHFENQDNLLTLALCPTEQDFDEMTDPEIHEYMEHVSDYDVRNLTTSPVSKHSITKE